MEEVKTEQLIGEKTLKVSVHNGLFLAIITVMINTTTITVGAGAARPLSHTCGGVLVMAIS